MVPVSLGMLCFGIVTCFWVLASANTFEVETKIQEVVGTNPASFSLWSALRRVNQSDSQPVGDSNREKFPNGDILKRHDSNGKPACCSCHSDESMTEREEGVKAARLSTVTDTILDKVRIETRDIKKISNDGNDNQGEPVLPKLPPTFLNQNLEDDMGPDFDENHAWDKQAIVSGKHFTEECPLHPVGECFSFDTSYLQNYEGTIQSSNLWLYTISNQRVQHPHHEVIVYEVLHHNMSHLGSTWNEHRIIVHSYTDIRDNWLQVDLTEFVQQYLLRESGPLSMAVVCETCYRDGHREMLGVEDGFKPLLVTNLLHKTHVREKRSQETDNACNPITSCCRRPLEVNFQRIGMHSVDGILNIGYCFGTCEVMPENTTNHTVLKESVRTVDPLTPSGLRTALRSCCVPTKLKPVSVHQYQNGHSSIIRIPNAKVAACGCR